MARKKIPVDVQPIDAAPKDGTPVILWMQPWGYMRRVYRWNDGAWRYGQGGCFTGSNEQHASHFRLATETERHLDEDFDKSHLPDLNGVH